MTENVPSPAVQAGTAWYVYGIVPAGSASATAGRAGVGASSVDLVAEGDVAALVSPVSLAEFGEEPLRENLNDRAWLERVARAHQETLDAALAGSAVVPFRLGTIYDSERHLREFLAERGPSLAGILRQLDGRVELGVKAHFDRAGFVDARVRERGARDSGDAESGRAYLVRRRLEQELALEADRFRAECARASHERLAAVAEDARVNPPQARELSGRADEMVLNAAYLVGRSDGRLRGAAAELEKRYGPLGVGYEVTGPWPPYNFVPRELFQA